MAREIKFRLRNRFNKIVGYEKWYEGVWHPDNPDRGFDITSGYWEASPRWLYSIDGKKWTPNYIAHRYKDSLTNLKDKNGVEIYEGDILEWLGKRYIVTITDGGWNPFIDDCQTDGAWHYTIIGNIHENLELLKGVRPDIYEAYKATDEALIAVIAEIEMTYKAIDKAEGREG